ncbi:hypothetical protein K469DRAFT_566739 [Zopfia rhizophila CBS 207.26]|uniref:Uncharacterized protein n=1 Tax=Zopfia rhizophila CBS 207.26 TaxID=1314779 RepID=A0A6A6EAB2_9PEZI|nr:hypothetical protein K469DRAFT_566739 [Zopfia rhizophila CBS 207.26]
MAFLRGVSDRFWNYVSPRKTQQRRDKLFKVPPLPQHAKTPHIKKVDANPSSMSPTTRIQNWNVRTPGSDGSVDNDYPLSPKSLPPKSLEQQLDRAYTDFEGDTLIDGLHEAVGDTDGFDANEETIVVDDGQYMDQKKSTDMEVERRRRDAQGRELLAAGWTKDAVFLFHKLGMRGFEPLMPSGWSYDFVMMPSMMFTPNIDKAFIKPTHDSDYRAQKALEKLLKVGSYARDAILLRASRTPECQIQEYIKTYNKWAVKDGRVHKKWNLPLFKIIVGPKDSNINILQQDMIDKLEKLADQWRDAFHERDVINSVEDARDESMKSEALPATHDYVQDLPTLYGVIASHTIMGIVSYDIMVPDPSLRTVAIFDFGQEDYDVWNSLAIAIFVIHCRNRMMELKDNLPVFEDKPKSDPDA